MTRLPLGLGVVLVVTLAVLPVSARAQSALVLDPARTYPLYAIGPIQRNGGAWMPPGTFVASRRASAFERQSLRESLALRGDPRVQWVVRAQPQIDEFDLIDPKTGVVERGGMRVPFDRRPIHDVDPTLPIPPDLLDGTPFEIRIVTSTEVRVPMLAARSAVRAEDDGTRSVAFLLIGFYLAVGLVFGLLFISLRERQLIVYAIVLLSLVAFEAINKGYAWQYLWPQASLEWHVPNALAFWAYYAALVIFCSFYLSSIGRLAIFRR
ncbi:MAG: hypothetical protein JO199_13500, partial [Candidatus Eremiobacteraeota bacterium]|nr:hypothetical protein [Candidatus Eremiobacteraeota bacterium]